jgi:hypothetical protein
MLDLKLVRVPGSPYLRVEAIPPRAPECARVAYISEGESDDAFNYLIARIDIKVYTSSAKEIMIQLRRR